MIHQQPFTVVSSSGVEIIDASQRRLLDLAAAYASPLGHRAAAIVAALTDACQSYLGGADDALTDAIAAEWSVPFSEFGDVALLPSAAQANEWAIRIARTLAAADDGSQSSRHRIVTLLGSDHGDTLACRSASGQVAGQAFGGPLAAGFQHVAAGDLRAISKAIDANTAAVLLAPVDWNRGGEPFAADYLAEVRQLCDANAALLIVDETRLPAALSGQWFFHQTPGIEADLVTAAAGWTGGLPGGLLLAHAAVIDRLQDHHDRSPSATEEGLFSLRAAGRLPLRDYPVLRAMVRATAAAVVELGGPEQLAALSEHWAAAWQELANSFEFISSVSTTGLWTIVQVDVPAAEVLAASEALGLRMQASGETTVLVCPPINLTVQEADSLLETLRAALETIERQAIES